MVSVLALVSLCTLLALGIVGMHEPARAEPARQAGLHVPAQPLEATATPLVYGPKAVAMPMHQDRNLGVLDLDWYYNATFGRPHVSDPRPYAYMVACGENVDRLGHTITITQAAQADHADGVRGRVWLIFNEPDDPVGQDGCGRIRLPGRPNIAANDPEGAALRFSQIYDWIKAGDPSAQVYGGGLTLLNSPHTHWWWTTFVNTLTVRGELDKLEGVHVHLYAPHLQSHGGCPGYDDHPARCAAWSANQWYTDCIMGAVTGVNL